jgi:hypothetical protein
VVEFLSKFYKVVKYPSSFFFLYIKKILWFCPLNGMIFWREKMMEKPLNIFPKLVEKKRWEGLRGFLWVFSPSISLKRTFTI